MSLDRGNVLLETSIGSVTLELYWDQAPKTCHNFFQLAKRGYYDGVKFHRIVRVRRIFLSFFFWCLNFFSLLSVADPVFGFV
jgi:hypothetical protein